MPPKNTMIFFATSSAANTCPPPAVTGTFTTTANGFFSATVERVGALRGLVGARRRDGDELELRGPTG